MRLISGFMLMAVFIGSDIAQASNTSFRIGYDAGKDMASRLWASKYHQDCFKSDGYFSELDQMQRRLTASTYHLGYRKGVDSQSDRVVKSCHDSKLGWGGTPKGECPQTGFQHGSQLGMQVCQSTRSSPRIANTCYQQALATCFDGLAKYVRENCGERLRSKDYRLAERECQQTFSQR